MNRVIYVVWSQLSDRSGNPTFIAAYRHEVDAHKLQEQISLAQPVQEVVVSSVQYFGDS